MLTRHRDVTSLIARSAPLRPCRRYPNCSALVAGGGFCERCAKAKNAAPWKQVGKTTAQRGYDAAWQRCREAYVAEHPMCEVCGRDLTRAVHHVRSLADRPDLRLDSENLLAVCGEACHRMAESRQSQVVEYKRVGGVGSIFRS